MVATVFTVLGGVGLFLYGMQAMAAGLRALASERARRLLARFTRSPLAGVASGALATAAVQSSSAVTVMTIGFVGAGLLTFPQAVGVVLGANIGTTVTGWMVVLVGFKLKLGLLALPILFGASLMRLLGRGRLAEAGGALAGFGLLFLGLELMQEGLAGLEGALTPASFPPDTPLGRAAMVAVGLGISLVLRSSSAGVALALVLLGGGQIGLTQAAALVIGMDIGTTFTGLLATIGGSRAMRRTGMAHLLYNLFTAVLAFAVLGVVPDLLARALGGDAQAALVAFHSGFNVAGVVLILPVVGAFARLVERLVPDEADALTAPLDEALLADPGAALDAAAAAARAQADALFAGLSRALAGEREAAARAAAASEAPLAALEGYLARLALPAGSGALLLRYEALLHVADHLRRLRHRAGQAERLAAAAREPRLARPVRVLAAALARAVAGAPAAETQRRLDRLSRRVAAAEARLRRDLAAVAVLRGVETARLFALTDASRWLARTTAHAARIAHYLARAADPAAPLPPPVAGG